MRKLGIGAIALLMYYSSYGQSVTPLPYFSFGKGLGITSPDSLFSMNIRFRIQNRAGFRTEDESDLSVSEVEARVRRLRLRLDGFVYSPRLTYVLQLSFSRGDMDWDNTNFPNIVRDAYIQYAVSKSFSVGIGQTKLPGNRQRITSSGDQQFADRSIVNAAFNIDRDFGVQFTYKKNLISLRGAVSTGDGRNVTVSDHGLAYTGRVEFLPFGSFTNGGEYFEGDLAREKTPKVAVGLVYHYNESATRTGGQIGNLLYTNANMTSQMVDILYKYKGWSFAGEYLMRSSPNPITTDASSNQRYVYVGFGQNYQGGYLFKNNIE
jgi:phosphate-selective porin OprO/OprP